MRLIHTADVHLGATPDANMPWSQERSLAIRSSFLRIISMAEKNQADLLLIAGDLFHRQPLLRELKELNDHFSTLSHTRVVIIAGNHDYICENSPYLNFSWNENVTFLTSDTMTSVYFEHINTEVHGFSYHSQEIREPLYDSCRAPRDGRIHILLAHGGDPTHIPIRLQKLADSGFHYVALGHIHQPRIYKNTNMAYCGSPEPLDKTDLGKRGCILADVTQDTCQIHWQTVSETQYRIFHITVTAETTQGSVMQTVRSELAANPMHIYRFHLGGFRDPDLMFDLGQIRRAGRVVEVLDHTEPAYDLEQLAAEHSHDLISHYIHELDREDATPRERKALFYGLRALLNPDHQTG